MDPQHSPFHKFQGWRLLALIVVTIAYSSWFTTLGPYGQLSDLFSGLPLEEMGWYTGRTAVSFLSGLDAAGQKLQYWSLLFDVPNMILTALMLEGLIGFGIRNMRLKKPAVNMFFVLPIMYLLIDFFENSFLALTMSTQSEFLGSIAGFMTAGKFLVVLPTFLIALVMFLGGLIAWTMRNLRKTENK